MKYHPVPYGSAPAAGSAPRALCALACSLILGVHGLAAEAPDGPSRTQDISLEKGWNAVFVEVQPHQDAPGQVFAGVPVDKVATLFENPVTDQFVTDPGIALGSTSGWGVWYAPELPEAFLKSLDAINGNRGYLVHAKQPCRVSITGSVEVEPTEWRADAFNLVGFSVAELGAPTFAQYFGGSKAHAGQAIYRLVKGRWKKVLQPSAETLRPGEAFWIYCKGPSDFQGPLRVETTSHQGLVLGEESASVVIRNACTHPLTPTLHHLPAAGPPVPLSIVVRTYGSPAEPVASAATPMPAGPWVQALPALESGGAVAVPFRCRREAMSQPGQASLLKITTDLGSVHWLPVRGSRDDIQR